MKKIKIKLKKCQYCGEDMQPRVFSTRAESNSEYQQRKFCNRDCMGEAYSIRWGEKKRKEA